MPSTPTPTPSLPRAPVALALAMASVLLALVLAYADSFSGPFVFDDLLAIPQNPSLEHLSTAFSPPTGKGATVQGRPVLNASFALNHALGGDAVAGYHVVNLAIHAGAALLLLGVVRRTLLRRGIGEAEALLTSWACALLWAVHPLHTESVTYVAQRAESLMGLWYLLCLYGYLRWVDAGAKRPGWLSVSLAACLLGIATKEVMVSAPVILWLYDGVFVSDGLAAAWKRHGRALLLIALSWIPLAWLVLASGNRGGTSGFNVGVSVGTYWATEAVGLFTYLKLMVVPTPLVFDYGTQWERNTLEALAAALVLAGVLVAAVLAVTARGERLRRLGPFGFAALFALAILATTSVIPGNRQALAEHRMYLPSAALLSLAVCLLARGVFRRGRVASTLGWIAGCLVVAGLFGELTFARNADYRTALGLYADTVSKAPDNAFARYNYAHALDDAGRVADAIEQYKAAVRLAPDRVDSRYNLANDYAAASDPAHAEEQYLETLRRKPDYALAHYNYANLLRAEGRNAEAVEHYRAALAKYPDFTEARANLGGLLLELGGTEEAEQQLVWVTTHAPDDVEARFNLAMVYYVQHRKDLEVRELEEVLRLKPDFQAAIDRLREASASP